MDLASFLGLHYSTNQPNIGRERGTAKVKTAAEWGPFNIQTNAVAPTVVLTDMGKMAWGDEEKSAPVKARIPLHRFGTPLEIADLVFFLASTVATARYRRSAGYCFISLVTNSFHSVTA
jgi:NAD(P)-dependent dehydrogenase (short-subunit alcohol dehydrogenase family)